MWCESWRMSAECSQAASTFCTSPVMLAACCPTAKPKRQGLQLEGKATESLSGCPGAQRDRIKRRDSCGMWDLSYPKRKRWSTLVTVPSTPAKFYLKNGKNCLRAGEIQRGGWAETACVYYTVFSLKQNCSQRFYTFCPKQKACSPCSL